MDFKGKNDGQLEAAPALWLVALGLCVGAGLAIVPLWAPLVLAAWTVSLARPLHERTAAKLGGSQRAAAVLTVGLVVTVLVPLIVLGVSLSTQAVALARRVLDSQDATGALISVISTGADSSKALPNVHQAKLGPREITDFMREHGTGTWNVLRTLAGATVRGVIGIFVFTLGVYVFLVDGRRAYDWLAEHAPIPRGIFERLARAFTETGRGLFIGVGLTAVGQAALATIGYLVAGVPQAFVLGMLTLFAAFIPSAGAALIWAPVALSLAMAGRTGSAIVLLVIGIVVSTADNFVRPALSRFGQLQLPSYLLLLSMLGGLAMFGGWGLMLGPLFVRLAVEALRILRERAPAPDADRVD